MTAWLERSQLPFPPGASFSPLALTIWNECRGIDWQALPYLAEMHGITDIETLIVELIAIREFQGAMND